ncbi:PAS domain-containing protein [Limnobacter sp.]|uniref:PAS domain-containing protein n=1 Tax=Limnobacter sp. TaxID=2003368 RepID=UPI002FE00473
MNFDSSVQEREILLRSAERMLNTLAWEVDIGSGQVSWHIFGNPEISPGFQTLLNASSMDEYLALVHPEDRGEVMTVLTDKTVQVGYRFTFQHRVFCKDGSVSQLKGSGEKHDKLGRPIIVGLLIDITEQVREKKRNSDLEQKLLSTLENMSDAFFIVSNKFEFLYLNLRTEKLLRRNRNDLVGKIIWEEFPEAIDTPIYPLYHDALKSGNPFNVKFYYPPLDTWFEVNGYPVAEGLAIYFKDVTGEQRQQEAAKLLQERFLLVSKVTNDVIWDWDLVNQKLWWNDSMCRVFGYTRAQLEPGPESWTNHIHPDDLDRVLESIHKVINGPETMWEGEYRFIKANGKYATVHDRGFVIRDDQGQGIRMLGSMLDLTERRELEEKLRESQKLEAMGQLTGGVAHDFNNLLTVILGNAEILLYRLSGNQPLQAMAEMTVKAAERGAELTSRLLSFARRQPLRPITLNANRLIRDSEELFQRTLPKSIEIDVVENEELWSMDVDASQLEVALLNLVINARDSMQNGGKLTIESANTYLDSDYAATEGEVAPGQYVRLTISDTGCGMTRETIKRAFEPFFTTKEVGKGSGLGLSMVFGFVKQSQGHIKIYSEMGAGTSVKLYFPRSKADTRPDPCVMEQGEIKGRNEHILIVEDDDLVREHLHSQLIEMGYRVTAAVDGPSALAVLEQIAHIDLLLTDIIMPNGINGRQLADMAKELKPDLKVLFTSGYTENTIVHDGKLDADLELLSKPYRKRELASKVRKVLGLTAN